MSRLSLDLQLTFLSLPVVAAAAEVTQEAVVAPVAIELAMDQGIFLVALARLNLPFKLL
tara:strand:+ start:326 stop:502 length:177 start_codon:yes stop_codon:yes gene_type:complete